jgi:uncharacterized protein YkwD
LRKYLVALLAIPVLAVVYGSTALRRSAVARTGVAVSLGAFLALGVMSVVRPASTTASLPTEIVPLTQAAFQATVATSVDLDAPVTLEFTTPMSAPSVASSITVEPATPVTLTWDGTFTTLTIAPAQHWDAGAYHTVTVQPGALAQTGRPLTTPARSVFLTRPPASTVLAASQPVGKRVAADTSFTIAFDRPIDGESLEPAIRLDPPAEGRVTAKAAVDGLIQYTFTPSAALGADTRYRLVVDGVRDEDGLELGTTSLEIRTTVAPTVVRFRPRADTSSVERGAAISVRFTRTMDRASTKAAFKVTADGTALSGKIRFAEDDTVLVFTPDKKLPYDAKVVATVAESARSADGAGLAEEGRATFTTEKKPTPAAPSSGGSSGGGGGGGSVGSGSWQAVERYYLGLMNCTRTGGTVTSSGSCSSPGGRDAAPLKLDAGISSKVARPYAKLLATRGACSHFIGGNPGDRLRRAGYTNYTWAENLGCRSGNAYNAVLASHRYFQSERSWSPQGGHYVNLMNRKYDRAGIGVWVSSGRVRLVIDFYHP